MAVDGVTEPKDPAQEPDRFSRRVHVTDPDAAFAELQGENDSLVEQIASLEARLPSAEELAYLRNRKAADDNAAWLWRSIKKHAPWVSIVGGAFSSILYWLVTHTVTITTGEKQ